MENKKVIFAGGGDEEKTAIRTPDNLRSEDNVEVLLGLCEGPIEGLEKGLKSFYVGDSKLENENGTKNYDDFEFEFLPGEGVGEEVNFFMGGATRNNSVNTELRQNVPIVRQTQAGNIDFLELRLVIQSLYMQTDDGIFYSSITLEILYKPLTAQEWINPFPNNYTIAGKTTSSYVRELRFMLPRIEVPYEIKITKLSPDSNGKELSTAISWESYQEGDTQISEFPHTALAHLRIKNTAQFSSLPQFYGDWKLLKIRVPSNYDPVTREYSGIWDGTFKKAWSDNPAWCLYDFVMNDRYGLNAFAPVVLDKWDTYEAAQWCDQLVSDGQGGLEPRYTCNMLMTDTTNGRRQAMYMASLFNAIMTEESVGYMRLRLEKDDQAVFLFTPENVDVEGFSYSFTSPESRFNDISVTFTNPKKEWQEDRRRITNELDIEKNGRVVYDFVAVGCIREGEARRRAYLKLITSLTEKMAVSFSTNRQAQSLALFDVILISDPVLGYAIPGRIVRMEGQKAILRDSVYFEAGIDYKVTFNTPDGIWESPITNEYGNAKSFIVENTVPDNLPELAAFTISGGATAGTPKPYRVTSISESEGHPDKFVVNAIELNREKWEASDNYMFEEIESSSGLPSMNNIPYAEDVTFSEFYDKRRGELQLFISPVLDYDKYPFYSGKVVVYSRKTGETSWNFREVNSGNIILNHPSELHEFLVLPVSTVGNTPNKENAPVYIYEVTNPSTPPMDVKGFTSQGIINGAQLSWEPNTDLDLKGYEVREGNEWDSARLVSTNISGNTLFVSITDIAEHTYLIKAVDNLENYSVNPADTLVSVVQPLDVQQFYATVNRDSIRFDWEPVPGFDITYIVRQGPNWETAEELFRVKGTNQTLLLPSIPGMVFSIKAYTEAGLYSKNPRYISVNAELFPNRNVILEVDNAEEGFPGISYGFEPVPYLEKAYVMSENTTVAEHYFNVSLNKKYRARNWLESEAFSFGARITWEDLHFTYGQPEAHVTWVNSTALDSKGSYKKLIMLKQEVKDYKKALGFSLENNLLDITGQVSPSIEQGISYVPTRMRNGLLVGSDTILNYQDLPKLPEVFNFTFKVRVTPESANSFILAAVKGEGGIFLRLYLNAGLLVLTGSDFKTIELPTKWLSETDFLVVTINQNATHRSLYFSAERANYVNGGSIEASPLGIFNELSIRRF